MGLYQLVNKKNYEILTDVRTLLRASTKTRLNDLDEDQIEIGRHQNAWPHIGIYPGVGSVYPLTWEVIIWVRTKGMGDETQIQQVTELASEVYDELIGVAQANRMLGSEFYLDNEGDTDFNLIMDKTKSDYIYIYEIRIPYRWGGDLSA